MFENGQFYLITMEEWLSVARYITLTNAASFFFLNNNKKKHHSVLYLKSRWLFNRPHSSSTMPDSNT